MPRVLLATDADWVHEEVDAALAGDDTAFLLMKDNTSADEFFHEIEKLL